MRKSMTYGTLPTREEFEVAFWEVCGNKVGSTFSFTNDPRVGTCELTASELWTELGKAKACMDNERRNITEQNEAGQWCSDVLGILGFEWI